MVNQGLLRSRRGLGSSTRNNNNSSNATGRAVIAVVGGAIMDMVFETERMPDLDESLDALSLVHKPGGKGSSTAIAIYRAQHNKAGGAGHSDGGGEPNTPKSNAHETYDLTDSEPPKKIEVSVYLNTMVGDDPSGRDLKKNLERNGVDTSGIHVSTKESTGTCAVFVEKFTGVSRDIGYPGANTNWTPRYQDSVECLADGNRPDLVLCHLENKRETVERVLETASRAGVDTLLNPSPVTYLLRETFRNVTHLVVNQKEAAQLALGDMKGEMETEDAWKEACEIFVDHGVKHVVITLGDKGAFWASGGRTGLVPAVKNVDVKDTTGAGDTFVGNYALEYVLQKQRGEDWNVQKAVERGCKAAARTIQRLGAQDAIPWADEIDVSLINGEA